MLRVVGEPVGLDSFLSSTSQVKQEDEQDDDKLSASSRVSTEETDGEGKVLNKSVGSKPPPILSTCVHNQNAAHSSSCRPLSVGTSSVHSSPTAGGFTNKHPLDVERNHAPAKEVHPSQSFTSAAPDEYAEHAMQNISHEQDAAPVDRNVLATTDQHYVIIKGTQVRIFPDWYAFPY